MKKAINPQEQQAFSLIGLQKEQVVIKTIAGAAIGQVIKTEGETITVKVFSGKKRQTFFNKQQGQNQIEVNLQNALALATENHPDVLLLRNNIASIESKQVNYPLVTLTDAAASMGVTNRSNGSKEISKAEKRGDLFTVEFFNGSRKVPLFQIDQQAKKPYPLVKELLNALTDDGTTAVESWLIYDWFTNSIDEDENMTPANLLNEKQAVDELLYLASQAGANLAGRIAV